MDVKMLISKHAHSLSATMSVNAYSFTHTFDNALQLLLQRNAPRQNAAFHWK